ncbi:MAG: hypothetical protein R2713_10550 [Ilumatobacteraceae bacterium]
MQLHLDDHEAHLLREVLRSYLKELRGEIVDTDNAGYKRELRRERDALDTIAAARRRLRRPATNRRSHARVQVTALWGGSPGRGM